MDDTVKLAKEPGGEDWGGRAVADEIMAIVNGKWFDICRMMRVSRSLETMRLAHGLPPAPQQEGSQYAGLIVLHCVNYAEMSDYSLCGVPQAVLASLGLDRRTGPRLLGQRAWKSVEQTYSDPFGVHSGQAHTGRIEAHQEMGGSVLLSVEESIRTHPACVPSRKGAAMGSGMVWRIVELIRRHTVFWRRTQTAPRAAASHPPWRGSFALTLAQIDLNADYPPCPHAEPMRLFLTDWEDC